jgi:hypothetical protein
LRDILVSYGAAAMKRRARHFDRREATALLALGCLIGGGIASSPAGAAPAKSPGPATQTLKSAVASARGEGSARITVRFFSGKTTGELGQDSALQSGKETVAIGKERISILLFHNKAYFSGNAPGLTSYFGFPEAEATTLAGQWVSVSPADSGFASVVAGLTLPAALKEATPTGAISKGKMKKLKGQLTTSISGTGSASKVPTSLFIAAKGKPLPVEAIASGGSGTQTSGEIVTFSRWGETVHIPTPPNAIPVSTLSSLSTGS